MKFFWERGRQQLIAAVLTIVMLAIPAMTGYAAANVSGLVSNKAASTYCQSCTSNPEVVEYAKKYFGLSAEVITGEEEYNYLSLLKSIDGFSDLKERLSKYRVVKVNPINYVYISGAFKEANNTLLYAVINGNNNEILMLKTVKYDGGDSVFVKDFLNDGVIKENKISLAEMARAKEEHEKEINAFMNKYDSRIELSAINWEYWVCQFAGELACAMGCLVFTPNAVLIGICDRMCKFFWGNGLCSKF